MRKIDPGKKNLKSQKASLLSSIICGICVYMNAGITQEGDDRMK